MNRKIVFLDIDGTLVDYENRLPDSAVLAVRKAREMGHKVYMCTGRSTAEIYPWLWDVGFDGVIGGNGSYIEDNGDVVFHQVIPEEEAHRLVDWLHERGLEFFLESNNGLFASENFEQAALSSVKAYAARKGADDATVSVRSVFPDMIFGGELYRDDLNKVSFLLNSYQDHLDSKDAFPDLKAGTWGGKGGEALFGDLGVKDIDKAKSMQRLLDHLGADVADSIAFGDATVDIPMLKASAYGVAMGNGSDEIKEAADYVTADVEDDGLYKAFEHLGLLDG